MTLYTEEDLGKKPNNKQNQTKTQSLNMTYMKDILPPRFKYNIIVTEFTNHWRRGQVYYPQYRANQHFQKKIDIPLKKGEKKIYKAG